VGGALQEVPPTYDQVAAMILDEEFAIYNEYEGSVNSAELAARNVAALGDRSTAALLANHGVLVFATSIRHAYLKCSALERRAKLAWHIHALGEGLGKPMDPQVAEERGRMFANREDPWPHLWEAVVRREVRNDPAVLD
jgi:ribulose-5-phosphate 4-epimerase/fuculose-1-phosphate aldolase